MNKKLREQIRQKYNGLCAYTGKPLDEKWQVDHVRPKTSWHWKQSSTFDKVDSIENLMPAIRIVNHYKRDHSADSFRQLLLTLHLRLKKLPKKTRVPRTEGRIKYLNEVAELFGITIDKPFSGVFYFETINQVNK